MYMMFGEVRTTTRSVTGPSSALAVSFVIAEKLVPPLVLLNRNFPSPLPGIPSSSADTTIVLPLATIPVIRWPSSVGRPCTRHVIDWSAGLIVPLRSPTAARGSGEISRLENEPVPA